MPIAKDAAGQQAGPPPAPGAVPAESPPGQGQSPPAGDYAGSDLSDEEQNEQLAMFLDNAYRMMYGGESPEGQINPNIAESLRAGAGAPAAEGGAAAGQQGASQGAVQALAGTAATVGASVAGSAIEQGLQIDGPGVVLPGTFSLVEDLADIAVREGIYDYSEEELAAAVMATGEQLFAQTQDLGLWKQEEFDAAVQEAIQLNESGQLDQMMPQTAGAASTMMGGGAPAGGQQGVPA